mgnify:CR=1 FL=1
MQEQRLTFRLQNYWEQIRKENEFPDIRQFNASIVEDIWPFCFQVSIGKKTPPTFTYDYMGEKLADVYGRNLTGLTVDPRMAHFPGSILSGGLTNVIHRRIPMQDNGHLINYDGKMVRYRACLLPFGNERDGLTHIIAGLSCRVA